MEHYLFNRYLWIICNILAIAPHSSTLAWKIPWMEEPGRLQSMGSQRVEHDWAPSLSRIGKGNGNPLQCFCLENPRDGVAQSRTWLKWLSSSSRHCIHQNSLDTKIILKFSAKEMKMEQPWDINCKYQERESSSLEPVFMYLDWRKICKSLHRRLKSWGGGWNGLCLRAFHFY